MVASSLRAAPPNTARAAPWFAERLTGTCEAPIPAGRWFGRLDWAGGAHQAYGTEQTTDRGEWPGEQAWEAERAAHLLY